MKRAAIAVAALVWCTGASLLAQTDTQRIQIDGFGGFGFGNTDYRSGEQFRTTYTDTSTELGLAAKGYLHDPRLANYNFAGFWDGNNSSIEQGRARLNGLSFNGSVNFLPERKTPFGFYFTRNRTNAWGSLIPAYVTATSTWGLRGQVKAPQVALFSYNLGVGKTENDLPNGNFFNTRQKFANLSATRNLGGWEMRFGDDFLSTRSTYSDFLYRNNVLSADASREFSQQIRVNLQGMYNRFRFQDLNGTNSSHSNVTLLSGNATWRHSDRLNSYYTAGISRNAVNTLRLLTSANGSEVGLPFNAISLDSMTERFSAGANYRATSDLNVGANLSYNHNGIPAASVATIPVDAQSALMTGSLTTGGTYNYRHKLRKLEYRSAGTVSWQHYNVLSGPNQSGVGLSLDNGVAGGNVQKLRFDVSYRYANLTNPVFFNVTKNTESYVNITLNSEYLRFVNLQGMADIGKETMGIINSDIKLDRNNYMFSAHFPKQKLNAYVTRGTSNSLDRILSMDSTLFQPGGSTGGTAIPGELLNPLVYSNVFTERAGLGWRPRSNVEIQALYSKYDYVFSFGQGSENIYRQFDTTVAYKFGRFTIFAGYGRALGEALRYDNRVNRLYFRVRFPFHVL